MSLPSRSASLLLLAALLGAAGVAAAAPQQQQHRGRALLPTEGDQQARRPPPRPDWAQPQPQPRRSEDALSDSVRRVEQRTRGQVLSAERVPYDGRNLNRIKVVDERGRVRVYMDDPQQAARQDQGNDTPTRDNDD